MTMSAPFQMGPAPGQSLCLDAWANDYEKASFKGLSRGFIAMIDKVIENEHDLASVLLQHQKMPSSS